MLEAEFVRKFPGKSLPFFQELRDNFTADEPLVKVALDYADVVKGTHIETTLAVSQICLVLLKTSLSPLSSPK